MSKKLTRAIAEGKVVVGNRTTCEVMIYIRLGDGTRKAVIVAPNGQRELAPKHLPASLVAKNTNLKSLLPRQLRIL